MIPGWGTKIISHSAATLFGALTCYAVLTKQISAKSKKDAASVTSDTKSNKEEEILEKGDGIQQNLLLNIAPTSPLTHFTPNPNLHITFDSRTKNPAYVVEKILQAQQLGKKNAVSRKGLAFREEPSLPDYHRSRNGYYRRSGFDRGHLAPAADFSYSQEAMSDTFSLSNISPQWGVFNRVVWSRLERMVRKLARKLEEDAEEEDFPRRDVETYIVTGPLWLPQKRLLSPSNTEDDQQRKQQQQGRDWFQYSHIGFGSPPSLIQVPSHFFKFVCAISRSKKYESQHELDDNDTVIHFAAFVLPNSNFEGYEEINLGDYLVRPSDLEAVSGLQFFPIVLNQGGAIPSNSTGSSATREDKLLRREAENEARRDLLHLWDLLTEEVWMEVSNNNTRQETILEDSPLLDSMDSMKSKARKAKTRAALRKKQSASPTGLQHLCRNNGCHDVIKFRN